MKKNVIGLLFLFFSFGVFAQDGDRISQLEREIKEVKEKLIKLESSIANINNIPKAIISTDGWKNIGNWRQLSRGMTRADVRRLLGEPVNISGGAIERWYYPNRADVSFWENVLDSWREPR